MRNFRSYASLGIAAVLLAGCGGGSTGSSATPSGASNSTLSTSLVDSPFRVSGGTVTAVNIAISKVELLGSGAPLVLATFSPSKQINLLDYQAAPLALSSGSIAPGTYQQLRLVLDTSAATNTNVVVNGTTSPLAIPSATGAVGFGSATSIDAGDGAGTSGIKVNVNLTAAAGAVYGYVIDFNAAESIVQTGAGAFMMKPVLVATAQNIAGSVAGTVKNNAGTAVSGAQVVAEQSGGVVVNSGVTDANGNFQINALPAGSYTLVVNNQWTSQAGAAQTATGADGTAAVTLGTAVTVTAGTTTSGIAITD
jgi:Domain of unknown function (DUF4382)/Carboxypeptidase regulatory-like domain